MSTAAQQQSKRASEVRNVAVSFAPKLDSGELLTGTPTVSEVTTSDLTIGNIAVSTDALTINRVSVQSGAAVQFNVSGGTAGTSYTIRVTATTDATPAQTLIVDVVLNVR